jgi:hypothetical protein
MKLSKHIFLMLGIASVFSLNHLDVMAASDCSSNVSAGRFCRKGEDYICRAGCFCTGGTKTGSSVDVTDSCNNRKNETELNKANIFLCPSYQPLSPQGASSRRDCYAESCNTVSSGNYCYKKNDKPKCPSGCYCKSGKDVNAIANVDGGSGGLEKSTFENACKRASEGKARWSGIEPGLNDRGVYYCPDGFPFSDRTDGYGPMDKTDCYQKMYTGSNGGYTKLNYNEIKCTAGKYLPKKSNKATDCAVCPDNNACPGGTFVPSVDKDQDIYVCSGTGTSLSADKSTCTVVCVEGTYFDASLQHCMNCPTSGNRYCTGANLTLPHTQNEGLKTCGNFEKPNTDYTGCMPRFSASTASTATEVNSNVNHSELIAVPVGTPTYTIQYNCGENGSGNPPANQTVYAGYEFSPRSNGDNNCVRSDFHFVKWKVQSGNDEFSAGETYTWNYSSNKTFVAIWEENTPDNPDIPDTPDDPDPATTFTVTYSCGTGATGTAPTDNSNYSSGYEVTAKIGTGCGSTFQNWLCGSDYYYPGESFYITADTTCTAQYSTTQQQTNCTITYNCDNGGLNQGPVVTEQNGQFQLKASSVCTAPSDLVFDKWKESVSGSESAAGSAFNCTGSDLTFIAIWRPYDQATDVPCGEGYYLPANEENCALCIAGSACPGGTYIKNYPADQGINQCVGNTFTSTTGATVCLNCPTGMGANATNTSCDGSGTGTYMTVPAGHYIPVGASTYMPCTDALVSYYNFCPGGQFLTNQSTPQGLFTCLDGGTAINNHTSCRVRLSEDRLKHGFNGLDCWKIDPIVYPTAYKNCVFSGTNQAAQ